MPPKATSTSRSGASRTSGRSQTENDSKPPSAPSGAPPSSNANTGASSSTSPSRPPVQRLQSLRGRSTPGPGIVPRPSNVGRENDSAAKPTIRQGPRNIGRRSKEERDAIVNTEARRNRERLLEAAEIHRARAATSSNAFRGAFRGRGRGRGGFQSRGAPPAYATTIASRDPSVARQSISRQSTVAPSRGRGDDFSSDEEDDYRSDFKKVSLGDLSPSDKRKGKGLELGGGGLPPVELEIRLREDQPITSIEAKDNQPIIKDDVDTTAPGQQLEPQIKAEPIEGDVDMRRLSPHVGESIDDTDTLLPAQSTKARGKVAEVGRGTVLGPNEDAEEYERHAADLKEMRALLAIEPTAEADPTTTSSNKEEDVPEDQHQGKLYLFQFPPLTPSLIVAGDNNSRINDPDNRRVQEVNGNQRAPNAGKRPMQGIVKQEDGEPEVEEVGGSALPEQPQKLVTAAQRQLPLGRVGQLHVHASGRVTMDWGGISFDVDLAQKVNFAQDALVVSPSSLSTAPAEGENDQALAAAVGQERPQGTLEAATPDKDKKVWAMGGLEAKFIAQPNWAKLV